MSASPAADPEVITTTTETMVVFGPFEMAILVAVLIFAGSVLYLIFRGPRDPK